MRLGASVRWHRPEAHGPSTQDRLGGPMGIPAASSWSVAPPRGGAPPPLHGDDAQRERGDGEDERDQCRAQALDVFDAHMPHECAREMRTLGGT